jgi:CheY-like chemotaxis protein
MPTVLIIDDNPSVATALEILLSLSGLRTLSAATPEAGLAMLGREAVDLVIQDMNFSADTTSGEEGVALFGRIRSRASGPAGDPAHCMDAPGVGGGIW